MPNRVISFAGQHLAIDFPRNLTELIAFLYHDNCSDLRAVPDVTLVVTDDDGQLMLSRGSTVLYEGAEPSELATSLIQQTIYHLIDNNKDGMALHAAALSRGGKAVIFPGASGSGKTSLSTWLATRGFNYLTDEYVFIKKNSNVIQAFMRPPNVKVSGLAALRGVFKLDEHEHSTIQGKHVAMIPPRLLNPGNKPENAEIKLIVFPKYVQAAPFKLQRLSKAKAGLSLMACLVNARNLSGHGFDEAARLVRNTPAYDLQYSSFEQFGTQLERILPT